MNKATKIVNEFVEELEDDTFESANYKSQILNGFLQATEYYKLQYNRCDNSNLYFAIPSIKCKLDEYWISKIRYPKLIFTQDYNGAIEISLQSPYSFYHPHIEPNDSGYMCLGNVEDIIYKHIHNGKIVAAIELTRIFLSTGDPDNGFEYSGKFFDYNVQCIQHKKRACKICPISKSIEWSMGLEY